MPFINNLAKEIGFKVVYFGPGMSGKTTNLLYIYSQLTDDRRGELFTLDTAEERTLFFDFFPLDLGSIEGYRVRFNLYTVPGQTYYEASRKLILDGADSVVFVADSQPDRLEDNLDSFRRLEANLREYALNPAEFPLVLQYNKRDCTDPIPLGTLERSFNLSSVQAFEAVATEGRGVLDTIRAACKLVISEFNL